MSHSSNAGNASYLSPRETNQRENRSEAIASYRQRAQRTNPAPRATREDHEQSRESRSRNSSSHTRSSRTCSPDSEVTQSSSCCGGKSSPHSEFSSIKSTVSLAIMSCDDSEEEDEFAQYVPKYPDSESFFPSPRMTFLHHQPQNLVCQICTVMPLRINSNDEDEDPVVLPCGHVSCARCMSDWFESLKHPADPRADPKAPSCPFCRTEMVHAGCGHSVKPRKIAADTVTSLPRTLAHGGVIPTKCADCYKTDFARHVKSKYRELKRMFYNAVAEASENPSGKNILSRDRAQKAFEKIGSHLEADYFREMQCRWFVLGTYLTYKNMEKYGRDSTCASRNGGNTLGAPDTIVSSLEEPITREIPNFLSQVGGPLTTPGHQTADFSGAMYLPAIDVLELVANEGLAWNQDINLLFAASGDWRNVVKRELDVEERGRRTKQSEFQEKRN